MRNHLRMLVLAAIACLSSAAGSAQSPAAATIRCAQCSLSGQNPDTSRADLSQIQIVEQLRPAFHDGLTMQGEIIARVLAVSPFLVETLDERTQLLDRNMRPVRESPDADGRCSVTRIEAIDRASQPILARLRLNDVIAGRMVWQDNAQRPDNFLAAQPVLVGIRRAAAPVRYLHTQPVPGCSNRSGQLLEYRGPSYDSVTVYNDGAIDYRDTLQRHFDRERLSERELAELLRAFAAVNFDTLTPSINTPANGSMPGITLVAGRYQDVWLADNEARLAPLVSKLKTVVARAISQTSFLLKTGSRQTLTIAPWPYTRVASLAGYVGVRDTARRRRQSGETPAGGPLEERLPDEFLNRLPGTPQMQDRDRDPNRFFYFSEQGALYRVMHDPRCIGEDWHCKSFYSLDVEQIDTIETRLRAQAARSFVANPSGSPSGARAAAAADPARLADYNLYVGGGADVYFWTADMFSTLAALPASSVTLSPDEYERHTAVYRAILNRRENGINLIQDGVVFEHVRVCQIEKGIADDCPIR